MNYNKQEILQLPVEEKLALVMELWESIEEKTNEEKGAFSIQRINY